MNEQSAIGPNEKTKSILLGIKDRKNVRAPFLQERFSMSFPQAQKTLDRLIEEGYLSPDGSVLIEKIIEALEGYCDPGICLLFFGVDGVLNCASTKEKCGETTGIDAQKVECLAKILLEYDAKAILLPNWECTWRKEEELKGRQDEAGNYLDSKLAKSGITLFDKAEGKPMSPGDAVREYIRRLEWSDIRVSDFLIIDRGLFDYAEVGLGSRLIQTGIDGGGLLPKHVRKAIQRMRKAGKGRP